MSDSFEPTSLPVDITPDPSLLRYYLIVSLVFGPFFFLAFIPLALRYRTLRYRLDEEGIRMRRGLLFRREVSLGYRRIQDMHLSSNVLERWMGLGKIRIQTASAGTEAEITVEGVRRTGALRDFLYERSRGARSDIDHPPESEDPSSDPLTDALEAIVAEIRALRGDLGGEVASGTTR